LVIKKNDMNIPKTQSSNNIGAAREVATFRSIRTLPHNRSFTGQDRKASVDASQVVAL